MHNAIRLRVSKTHTGKGVFATAPIKKGSLIVKMTGRLLDSEAAMEVAVKRGRITWDDPFQISEDAYLELDRIPYFFNHSCEPNAGFKKGNSMIALRDITKGEEIRYDYRTVVCAHSGWSMHCNCKAPTCKKRIGNIRTIPKKQLEYYLKNYLVPAFIRKELARTVR